MEQRRFPRLSFEKSAEIEVRVRCGDEIRRSVIRVVIRSASCEGVGLALREDPGVLIAPGMAVTTRFPLGKEVLELPGRVVWVADRGESQELDLGVRFQLEGALLRSRHTYATWIVSRLRRARRAPIPPALVGPR